MWILQATLGQALDLVFHDIIKTDIMANFPFKITLMRGIVEKSFIGNKINLFPHITLQINFNVFALICPLTPM